MPSSMEHSLNVRRLMVFVDAVAAHAAEVVSKYVPTRTAPPARGGLQTSASGSQLTCESHEPCEVLFESQLKRNEPHSCAGVTRFAPPGCTQLVKSKMGTGPQLAPATPL